MMRVAGIRYVTEAARRYRLEELVDLEDIARAAGVNRRTLHTYRFATKTDYNFPEPVAYIGITPVWTKDQARAWIAQRPGRGARVDMYREGRAVPDFEKLDTDRLVGADE